MLKLVAWSEQLRQPMQMAKTANSWSSARILLNGYVAVLVRGDVGSVKAATEAGSIAARRVGTDHRSRYSRPYDETEKLLQHWLPSIKSATVLRVNSSIQYGQRPRIDPGSRDLSNIPQRLAEIENFTEDQVERILLKISKPASECRIVGSRCG